MLRKNSINKNFIHEIIDQTNINYQMNTKNQININSQIFYRNPLIYFQFKKWDET